MIKLIKMEASKFVDAEANKFVEFDYKKTKVHQKLKKRARQYKCKYLHTAYSLFSWLKWQRGGGR